MPIVLPKCPSGYELNKETCRCKKSVTKKKAPKKPKKKVNKTVKKKVKCNAAKKREKVCNIYHIFNNRDYKILKH